MPSDASSAGASPSASDAAVSRTNHAALMGGLTAAAFDAGAIGLRALTASATSSSTVAAVTVGPAPGPLKNSSPDQRVENATAFCPPPTRQSACDPST